MNFGKTVAAKQKISSNFYRVILFLRSWPIFFAEIILHPIFLKGLFLLIFTLYLFSPSRICLQRYYYSNFMFWETFLCLLRYFGCFIWTLQLECLFSSLSSPFQGLLCLFAQKSQKQLVHDDYFLFHHFSRSLYWSMIYGTASRCWSCSQHYLPKTSEWRYLHQQLLILRICSIGLLNSKLKVLFNSFSIGWNSWLTV